MQTVDKQLLRNLSIEIASAFDDFSTLTGEYAGRVSEIQSRLDSELERIQRDREELDILFSLENESEELTQAPHSVELEQTERELAIESHAYLLLAQSLADFRSAVITMGNRIKSGDLDGTGDDLADASAKMGEIRAREDERRRFASDIHDGPAQAFANAIIGLEFVQRALRSEGRNAASEALNEIERIKISMREGLTEIRRFIFDNRPTMLEDRGLVATVEHYVQRYQPIFATKVQLDVDDTVPDLEPDLELTAFRVVQESIQNANKHARATLIQVGIHQVGDRLAITISDDGRGFSPDRVRTHALGGAGLVGMEERVRLNGGEFEIESQTGLGTTIKVLLPMHTS